MANEIHRLAVVHPDAEIGEGCHIGPFCTVGPHVTIGDNSRLQSHVVVDGRTTIGAGCQVFPFASIGVQSQDLKFREGNITYTEVGAQTIVREHVTIHSATEDGTATVVGSHCALLALSHVGHNCRVGNHVVLSHAATLGGHVEIGDFSNLGGLCAIHQFVRIGEGAMIAGMARVVQDILPYTIAEGWPATMRSVNKIGMSRRDIPQEDIHTVYKAFRTIFRRGLRLEEAIHRLRAEFPGHPLVDKMIALAERSERGLARPPSQAAP